ncbi:MAG: hypothetical protein K9J37_09290 [Saprospiraceae bacterium]|nr:hypothetical protein [Saprospiraceae bacterium]MCF8250097.1 hypothetical protein [Saprospiraceae bacterium]MCF8279559.1 hypothetical protein [Bacteroidales bacterium]MCF8311937.1 hypothetical protein [Saprospiraceae bacterium]MCF8440373.1 hypothetical protein [Saprospiraceae bacterium]
MNRTSDKVGFFNKWLPIGLLCLAAVLLLTYTTLRADLLSLTHDECGSFAIWTNYDIFTCRTNPNCWGSANLHWLYVLLMKISVGLFGDSELSIRLPALLGHVIYLVFSYKLVDWSVKNLPAPSYLTPHTSYLKLFGFILLNFNAYLLEFFSLARGYGLAMSMMMVSLYFLARWVESGRLAPLLGALGGAALAVFSNFTLLIYFACLLAVIGGMVVWAFLKKDENGAQRAQWAAIASLSFASVLGWLLHNPIRILRERGEFEWGRPAFYDTYKSVVHCSLYGGRYLKMYNLELFGGLFFVLLLAATGLAVANFMKKPKDTAARFYLAAVALPLLAALAAIAQHWLLDTQYQVDRTAIMFIPLCALAVFLFFQTWLGQKRSPWRVGLAVFVGLFCVVHFGRVAQLRYTSEWGYDAETKNMMAYMNAKIPDGTKVKLGVHWLYHPAASYYQKRFGYDFTEPPVYSKNLFLDSRYDYYYVQPDDMPALDSLYEVEARFSWVGVLLRKK